MVRTKSNNSRRKVGNRRTVGKTLSNRNRRTMKNRKTLGNRNRRTAKNRKTLGIVIDCG